MIKTFSKVSRKICNLNANKAFVILIDFQSNYMFYWRFHFDNETPINCSFTQWKWTYILDVRPWGWSALNMAFVGKWPSRMHEQWVFPKSGGRAAVFSWVRKILIFWEGGCPCPILTLRKVREGEFNVLCTEYIYDTLIHGRYAFHTKFAVTVHLKLRKINSYNITF